MLSIENDIHGLLKLQHCNTHNIYHHHKKYLQWEQQNGEATFYQQICWYFQ